MLKDIQNDKYTNEYEDSDRVGLVDTQTYRQTPAHRQVDRHTDKQTNRQTVREEGRQTDSQTVREEGRQTER